MSRSENMARIRAVDTRPEVRLRKALWALGLRYRKNAKTPCGRPDVVFPGAKVAVFVDGGFWHGCPRHYVRPRSREAFWSGKLRENVDRDRKQTLALESEGWRVLRFWECEVYERLEVCVERVSEVVRNGASPSDSDAWRVVSVEVVYALTNCERRHLEALRDPVRVQTEVGPRVTAKWRIPRATPR